MALAGAALDECVARHWPHIQTMWICCGAGNNGGDGYVLARLAKARGLRVRLFALGEPKPETEAALARLAWLEAGGLIESTLPTTSPPDLLVDALLGIGPVDTLRGPICDWIPWLNQQGCPILAVDIPSGLQAATGVSLGVTVQATRTLTFIGLKPGLLTGRGVDYAGQVELASLGLAQLTDWPETANPVMLRVDFSCIADRLPQRQRSANKGDAGRVLLMGGGAGMPGAIRLAAEACLRTGAGLVRVASHQDNQWMIQATRPEAMWCAMSEASAQAGWASVRVLGPGLGQSDWAQALCLAQWDLPGPMVLDADGLNLLARQPRWRSDWILTPHPGEAARLLGCSVATVEQDRLTAVQALQKKYGGVVLLKGAGSLIFDGNQLWICQEGNPGMASGGMGDLLSGIIAALWAQGLPQAMAAWLGAVIHGEAGDLAAADGERGMLASDLLPYIRHLVNPAR